MEPATLAAPDPRLWKAAWVAELDHVAARDRWGRAFVAIGFIHLTAFLICHAMKVSGDRREWPYVAIWFTEFFAVLAAMRMIAGRGWYSSTPMAAMLARVWGTFLLLSFNLACMNTLSGLEHQWFQPALATLATFGFATTAYLLDVRFFIPAVQMYFTGLLMIRNPGHYYLIHGVSWCATLLTLGVILERRRAAVLARSAAPTFAAHSARQAG